jgi:ABC-type branched-subunit amino acid transport system permease subunit
VVPSTLEDWVKPVTYVGLVALVLALTVVRGWTRVVLLIPTLVLAVFVWENVMVVTPDATRYVVLGAILVAVMIVRPNGILGEKRVEIV